MLTFIPHNKYVKVKCLYTMNLLKVLSRATRGSDRKRLLNFYTSFVHYRLDYGAIIRHYGISSPLKMLDIVDRLSIRLATGAFRTIPVESLYVD